MRKLIHSSFELDLQSYNLVDNENNSIFADTFFAKITYPFTIDLIDDLNVAFGFISSYTTKPETIYECIYCHYDKLEKAEFEILEINGKKLSCTITVGFENLASWDKKLSELSLINIQLPQGTTIYQHAESIVNMTYPATNYNFPMIHSNKDTLGEPDMIINKRIPAGFLENYVDGNNESVNQNIMQALPYWMYVLKRGCLDAGYTLAGEILNDLLLKNLLFFTDANNVKITEYKEYEFHKLIDPNFPDNEVNDFIPMPNSSNGYRNEKVIIKPVPKGVYRLTLEGLIRSNNGTDNVTIFLNGFYVYSKDYDYINTFFQADIAIDMFITVDDAPNNVIEVVVNYEVENTICDVLLVPVYYLDQYNNKIPSVFNPHEINLTKTVPDMTFGDFVSIIKNWFNYSFDIVGSTIVMNKISNLADYNNAVSLELLEIEKPNRKFQKGISFLHQFTDVNNKDYIYKKVFQNSAGVVTSGYKEDAKTNVIEVNGLPLPLKTIDNINTAFAFEDDSSKLYAVRYAGLTNNQNICTSTENIHLDQIHTEYWYKWLYFRINTILHKWQFKSHYIHLLALTLKSTIFAYQNFHLIKSIQRTEIAPDIFEYDIETESLI